MTLFFFKCCLLLYERVMCCCAAWWMAMVVFPVFPAFSSFHSKFFLSCAPWPYCRTNSLELHTGTRSSISGIRRATGGRQPAAATPPLHNIYCIYMYKVPLRDEVGLESRGCRKLKRRQHVQASLYTSIYVYDEIGSTMCGRRDKMGVEMYCCCCAVVTSSHILLVVNTAYTNTKSPWLSQRPERGSRVLLYHCCWTTAAAAAVVPLLSCCYTAAVVLLLYRCCRCRSKYSRGCVLLRISDEVSCPPRKYTAL